MRLLRSVFVGLVLAGCWGGAAQATTSPDPSSPPATTVPAGTGDGVPVLLESPPPIVDPNVVTAPLVVVPPSCSAHPLPVAVFVGTIAASDATTARFAVEQIRAGTLDGYAVATMVDVRYDDDIRFLRTGQQYLVGAAPDPLTGVLRSKVRLQAPLFGGDAVIGIDDTDVSCPRVEDGVKTLHVDGTGVDTGVLAPLKTAKRSVLRAVLKPLGIAFAVLVCLTAIKMLVFAMVRALREPGFDDDADEFLPSLDVQRDRHHVGGELDEAQRRADAELMGERL